MKTTITTFKDFENIPNVSLFERIYQNNQYMDELKAKGLFNYLLTIESACGPIVRLKSVQGHDSLDYINFSSNDYLGYTQHSQLKNAVKEAIEKYGTGAGASPLIGGFYDYHTELENTLSAFFKRQHGSSIIYTTGYTANSATLLALLKKEDIAIIDLEVHSSIYEGLSGTNTKRFLHNDMVGLERILSGVKNKYRTKMVIVDGVYSQNGDLAKLKEIIEIVKQYDALVMVDDAHGIGVIGETGRGVIELDNLYNEVDIIMGTFSKAIGNLGGFVVADPELIRYMYFQSRQFAFSTYAPPSIVGATKAFQLIDEEPQTREKLWENIRYYKSGLIALGLNVGATSSAIIPVKIGNPTDACEAAKQLLKRGIFANPIIYPGVALNDARVRMSIMATHQKEHLDKALNVFEDLIKKKIINSGQTNR